MMDPRRIYTIWPADQEGRPATTSGTWQQHRRWLVLDITDGLAEAHVVEGPVTRAGAHHRATELRNVDRMQVEPPMGAPRSAAWPAVHRRRAAQTRTPARKRVG